MCHACVTEAVKARMMSRRDLLRATPAAMAGATAASAGLGLAPALAQGARTVEDLTHTLSKEFPTYFGAPGFSADRTFTFADNGFNLFNLSINEHTGTHIDAPLHFSADGSAVDEIPVSSLVCPLAVIDIREKADRDDEAMVTPEDLSAWISANGELPQGCAVAMLSGWEKRLATEGGFRNADAEGTMRFPGFHPDATAMLMEEAECVGIAVDTLSLDIGSSQEFTVHYDWLPTGRWGLECVAGLDRLPAAGATLVVGAPKHRGGSGGPTRVMALV